MASSAPEEGFVATFTDVGGAEASAEASSLLSASSPTSSSSSSPAAAAGTSSSSSTEAAPAVRNEMPAEAAEAKERGNALFAAGDFEGALALYEDAIAMAMEGVTGLASAPLGAAVFHANRAACLMKLERFEECIEACDDALDIDESYLKAMLRRAAALEKLDKLDEAVQDYEDILEAHPKTVEARQALVRLRERAKVRDEKLKDEMMGKLKDLGNSLLGKIGLSLDNFELKQDEKTGGYSINYRQGGQGGESGADGGAQPPPASS